MLEAAQHVAFRRGAVVSFPNKFLSLTGRNLIGHDTLGYIKLKPALI